VTVEVGCLPRSEQSYDELIAYCLLLIAYCLLLIAY